MNSMLKEAVFYKDLDAVAAGQAANEGAILDMSGYGSVCFVLAIGDAAVGAVILLWWARVWGVGACRARG